MGLGRRCRESLFVMGTAKHELIILVFLLFSLLVFEYDDHRKLHALPSRHDFYASYASYTGSLL